MMSKQVVASATADCHFPARHGADTERARRAAALFLQRVPWRRVQAAVSL
jgi:hypothetical protein